MKNQSPEEALELLIQEAERITRLYLAARRLAAAARNVRVKIH
jgi:hypothetical protein